jgi:hypothetical protein
MNQFCINCGSKLDGVSDCKCESAAEPALEPAAADSALENESAHEFAAADSVTENESDTKSESITVTFTEPPGESATPTAPTRVSTGRKVAFAALSVVTSLALFFTITLAMSVIVARQTVRLQTVQAMARLIVEDVDVGELQVGGVIDVMSVTIPDFGRNQIGSNTILSEVIFNSLHDYYITTYGVGEDEVRQLLSNRELNRFIGEIAAQGVEFIMTGDNHRDAIIGSERLVSLVQNNAAEIERVTGFPFDSNPEYETILRDTLSRSGIDNLTWGSALDSGTPVFREIRSGFENFNRFSVMILVAAIVVAVGLAVALVALNLRRKTNALLYFGIPCIVSGITAIVASILTGLFLRWMAEAAGLSTTLTVEIAIQRAFSEITNGLLAAGVICLVAGALMVAGKIAVVALFPAAQDSPLATTPLRLKNLTG